MRHLLLTASLLLASTLPALAGSQDFKLINKTGYQIDEVYVGAVGSNSWGNDIMGKGALAPGASVSITFTAPADACKWDMFVKYSDGETAEWGNINLCTIDSISLYWDKKAGTSRAVADE